MSNDFYKSYILPYAGIIIKICRAYTDTEEDFQDYYQEVCLQIWRTRDNFQQNAQWSTWIYRITLNVCLTLLKKQKKAPKQVDSDYEPSESPNYGESALDMLYAAIRKLSEVDRAVILLYLEEKSYQEIAEIIGTNANNIGVRINRIKSRLKNMLHGQLN